MGLATTSAAAHPIARRPGHRKLERTRSTIEEDRRDAASVAATIPTKLPSPA